MLELDIKAHRGQFALAASCRLVSPWTVLFGPSGAGKSTILRLIAGLDHPDQARIVLDDQLLTDTASNRHIKPGPSRCGLVTQRPALFPHISVAENIGYGITNLTSTECSQRIESTLALVGANDLSHRPVHALSGGESQRIALARALAPQPRLLLLDEPLSAVGSDARDAILSRLRTWLAEHKIQTILVTHDVIDALTTDAEVALMQEGRITALGPAADVLAAERNRLLSRLQMSQSN
ncbi:ABC transporter ATP-binding protein [Acidicapsa dinghuensis]|uniref:ABC transporter ATP-binding protein n=1 Tax=Acidicapsa dinghuensis TaxID=2218256 RepID=A0ABW1EK86_9BACT|nr:ATP-binding cassette domain-containing protein [Acidicapsa dinghuensis]